MKVYKPNLIILQITFIITPLDFKFLLDVSYYNFLWTNITNCNAFSIPHASFCATAFYWATLLSKFFASQLPKLHPFITDALVNNRVDFLRLFIERGAIIKDYLTVVRLRRLYNSAPDTCFLRTLVDNVLNRKVLSGLCHFYWKFPLNGRCCSGKPGIFLPFIMKSTILSPSPAWNQVIGIWNIRSKRELVHVYVIFNQI